VRVAVAEVASGDQEIARRHLADETLRERCHADAAQHVQVKGADVLDADDLVDIEIVSKCPGDPPPQDHDDSLGSMISPASAEAATVSALPM
jgi:hypothetical protein